MVDKKSTKPSKKKKEAKTEKAKLEDIASVEVAIKEGKKVKFHYVGRLETGQKFDSSEGRAPLEFEVGKGMIIPGLEKELVGMKKGNKKTITVMPEEAYGERNEQYIREIPKGPVPEGMVLQKGAILYLRTPEGQPFPATVVEVKEQTIILDFNHPLAGKKLIFDVEIVEIN